ncbi:ubiquinol-cytochrome c reductase cytochrome c1 subunit [Paracoccus aminovorans]|uniref:Cytochrome c1 n=1 Tax=Paracoccus aminovorans TaxID=34004 RepID=A0A1I3B044_9RHOB|nr:ubiquinol-cytochrome C reductase, cytochrome c1 subunit [Paracoccus aminovorans]SFH55654.1 ubiquinol-cytochrome c reductase cytochrome c1 subunit [Paracoccus aminovorans]
MTLRNASLTAVAALTVALAGGAVAQDTSTAPGTTAPAGSSYQTDTPAASAAEAPQPAAEAAAEPAAEPEAAPEPAEQPAAEAGAQPAADAAAEPAQAEQPATATEEAKPEAAEQPAQEAPAAAEQEAPAAEAPAAEAAEEPAAAEPAAEAPAEAPEAAAEGETQPEGTAAEAAPVEDHAAAEAPAASHEAAHIEDISFSFEGPFGKYDQFQLQRGLQVYTEVCAACHGLRYVPLRTLGDEGGPQLPEDQVRAYAANFDITDAETGEDRPREPTDHFPTVHGDGMGPDLSLMAKARAGFHGPYGTGISQLFNGIGGPEYIHAILTGFNGEEKEEAGSTFYHNAAFAGNWIKMPPPLSDGQVTYEDGTEATVDQMSRDVSAFLMWTAEPKMMDRKQVGFVSVIFLVVLAALLYLTNKKLWAPIKHPRRPE